LALADKPRFDGEFVKPQENIESNQKRRRVKEDSVIPGRALDVQLHIGESRDSGFDAEPVIGPRFARTRWHRPGMTA
jgi:hypothetical protein